MSALKESVKEWISDLPAELFDTIEITAEDLSSTFPKSYSLYPPMLLLPAHSFQSEPWTKLLQTVEIRHKNALYKRIAKAMSVTHIAINAPIPISNTHSTKPTANILRSPTNLQPLFGDFGPAITSRPTAQDFSNAFWVCSKQNGIYQTWAPLYTMFSRGNISEKARILHLETLKSPAVDPQECTAVDLYAGIGYFAFSYAAAGVKKVLCWEINEWSVEGLKRGAGANRWAVEIVEDGEALGVDHGGLDWVRNKRLVVFQESNAKALGRVEALREYLPPIRHVNCGLLPSSRSSWRIAIEVLDPEYGGWIHVHQNVAVKDIEEVKSEIVVEICELVKAVESMRGKNSWNRGAHPENLVDCQHIERVKSYAPGVMHCVLDIKIEPRSTRDRKPE
ncbi:MAG: hypothetical protein M1836_007614 [Candelina mexicana]|nr:MAG: hypothetical protein M1836_007614 [Candelina mexicana]